MPYVLTVDQRRSRRGSDLVDVTIDEISTIVPHLELPFERTAGDEFQGSVGSASDTLAVTLRLLRTGRWSVGLGIGSIEAGASTRASRGPAFVRAREAVDLAKRRPHHVAILGPPAPDDAEKTSDPRDTSAGQADALVTMVAAVLDRRTEPGWEAIDLVEAGLSVGEAAAKLGVSRQAVGQRLSVALWREEIDVRHVAARLLAESEEHG